ncbi:MAG: hypothetical protein U9Q83_00510, partial [Bacteroidota bacterium]|nr:hypothetical protein [Bacteroidota bacterium]
ETLLAFNYFATDEFDKGYDGVKRKGNANISFYSLMDNQEMGIQTFSNQIENKEILLGFETQVQGDYSISIKDYDMPDNYDILLIDNSENTITNLNQQEYTFSTSKGIFKNRFVLNISEKFVTVPINENNSKEIKIYSDKNNIYIVNQSDEQINNAVFILTDIQGRVILKEHINLTSSSEINIPIIEQKGIYVSVIFWGNNKISQKIYFE